VPHLKVLYGSCDLIFQDCETSKFVSPVHAHYTELLRLPDAIRKKMWLYHCQDGAKADAIEHGFAGFVKQGQTFDLA
jgi:hypothetical protein